MIFRVLINNANDVRGVLGTAAMADKGTRRLIQAADGGRDSIREGKPQQYKPA